ncbi:MAG: hypothetical protein LBB84_07630 [Tannerellaceae bacterium]|jgi:hypothetical protein|nr:hypothetical protein [Tannerellaceae bacterium]
MRISENYYDEVFPFGGAWEMPSKCGLKIIRKEGKCYVIVTELYRDNPGTSVTYAGRSLARQICEAKGLCPESIIYIECNPDMNSKLSFYDEEYYQVHFHDGLPATYRLLSREEVNDLFEHTDMK